MKLIVEEMKKVMKNQELDANLLIEIIALQNLHQMIIVGENLRINLINDYEIVRSQFVKSLLLEEYQRINRNIKAVRHAIKFYGFGFSLN